MIKEQSLKKMICRQSQIPFLRLINTVYDNFKLELEAEYKRGQDSILSRTCESCKLFRNADKACFLNSQNVYIRPASIDFSGCGRWEQK